MESLVLKYLYSDIFLNEIPGEISLGIVIVGCPIHCPECHSKHIWDINSKGIGIPLTNEEINKILASQKHYSNILFFGGDWDVISLSEVLFCISTKRSRIDDFKLSLYSGYPEEKNSKNGLFSLLNYIKVGNYLGKGYSLKYKETNQRLYTINNGKLDKDITYKFWKGNEHIK